MTISGKQITWRAIGPVLTVGFIGMLGALSLSGCKKEEKLDSLTKTSVEFSKTVVVEDPTDDPLPPAPPVCTPVLPYNTKLCRLHGSRVSGRLSFLCNFKGLIRLTENSGADDPTEDLTSEDKIEETRSFAKDEGDRATPPGQERRLRKIRERSARTEKRERQPNLHRMVRRGTVKQHDQENDGELKVADHDLKAEIDSDDADQDSNDGLIAVGPESKKGTKVPFPKGLKCPTIIRGGKGRFFLVLGGQRVNGDPNLHVTFVNARGTQLFRAEIPSIAGREVVGFTTAALLERASISTAKKASLRLAVGPKGIIILTNDLKAFVVTPSAVKALVSLGPDELDVTPLALTALEVTALKERALEIPKCSGCTQ